jgi:hypothetical protein
MTAVEEKKFTPEQADRMLPLVRRIMEDILKTGNEMKTMARETMTGEQASRLEKRIADLKIYLKELEDLGCAYRDWDFRHGMVDFPSELDGEPVWLNWRSDEASVTHYYPIDDTPHKRRPLPEITAPPDR